MGQQVEKSQYDLFPTRNQMKSYYEVKDRHKWMLHILYTIIIRSEIPTNLKIAGSP
jgi:hypothetical protein